MNFGQYISEGNLKAYIVKKKSDIARKKYDMQQDIRNLDDKLAAAVKRQDKNAIKYWSDHRDDMIAKLKDLDESVKEDTREDNYSSSDLKDNERYHDGHKVTVIDKKPDSDKQVWVKQGDKEIQVNLEDLSAAENDKDGKNQPKNFDEDINHLAIVKGIVESFEKAGPVGKDEEDICEVAKSIISVHKMTGKIHEGSKKWIEKNIKENTDSFEEGDQVMITYGDFKNKKGIITDKPAKGYSIVKIGSKETTVDDLTLKLIKRNPL